jgi:hypothetical protein
MQIPNATTMTLKQKEELVNFICYKHQKNNIMNLRKVVGDEGLLSLLNKFAGTYTKFPPITQIVQLANQLHLVTLYDELKAAAVSGDPSKWQEAENRFVKFAEMKFELTDYTTAKLRAKQLKMEFAKAKEWVEALNSWENRNTPNE